MLIRRVIELNEKANQRFCFILGAGASRESGIKTGKELAKLWLKEFEEFTNSEKNHIESTTGIDLQSIDRENPDYSNMYALRYSGIEAAGVGFLEEMLSNATPSFGYYPLVCELTGVNNIVITTNFDSLIQQALQVYRGLFCRVISDSALAEYFNPNYRKPQILKIHGDMFLRPLSKKEDLLTLDHKWKTALNALFAAYTPIFIGYNGGDNGFMEYLINSDFQNRIYWCYYSDIKNLQPDVLKLIRQKNGVLVKSLGFDALMYQLYAQRGYSDPSGFLDENSSSYKACFFKALLRFEEDKAEQSVELKMLIRSQQQKEEEKITERLAGKCDSNALFELLRLSDILTQNKKYNEAILCLLECLKIDTNNSELFYKLGALYIKTKEFMKSIECFTVSLYFDTKNYLAYLGRAYAFWQMKYMLLAKKDFHGRSITINIMILQTNSLK